MFSLYFDHTGMFDLHFNRFSGTGTFNLSCLMCLVSSCLVIGHICSYNDDFLLYFLLGIHNIYLYIYTYWSEAAALTGYDIPGCVEDGALMLWRNSSVAGVAAAAQGVWGGEGRDLGFS